MNVDQCKALGLAPYAVYGGKVESFKVREHAPETYGDPVLLKALDQLIAERDYANARMNTLTADLASEVEAHKEQRANHLALWSSIAAIARRLLPNGMSFNAEDALQAIQRAMDELDALKKQIAAGEPFDSDEIEAMNVGEIKMWLDSEYRWHVESPERLPPGTYNAKVIEQPRFDNDGPWVDALSDAVAKARMVQPEEAVGKPTVGFEHVVGRGQRFFHGPRIDIKEFEHRRCCNNCAREKSSCPYHVSGPMYGCTAWRSK